MIHEPMTRATMRWALLRNRNETSATNTSANMAPIPLPKSIGIASAFDATSGRESRAIVRPTTAAAPQASAVGVHRVTTSRPRMPVAARRMSAASASPTAKAAAMSPHKRAAAKTARPKHAHILRVVGDGKPPVVPEAEAGPPVLQRERQPALEVEVGETTAAAQAGETLRYRCDMPHRIRNLSGKSAHATMVCILKAAMMD